MKYLLILAVGLCGICALFSCKQSSYSIPVGNGRVNVSFANSAGSGSLNLGQTYTNQHGDAFTVNMFKYYISNIKMSGSGVSYTEANSYHLIDQNNMADASFQLADMQYGQYTSITFTIGVDSTRNVSGAQTGALDPAKNMFLTSSTGYVMLKLEGTSPQSTQPANALIFHSTGFYGPNTALRTITLSLPTPINVSGDVTALTHVNVSADVLKLFKAPTVFDFSTLNSIQTSGADVTKLADNYAQMFTVASSGL